MSPERTREPAPLARAEGHVSVVAAMAQPDLELRMLGGLDVRRGGEPLPQPPSKKTRALLAYLALTGRAHRREALCNLLWDVTDDPRGALRWSLSKLRKQVDDDGATRL
jgi:DNA-binding SARP family transcriptional activator